jgi:hypothetical protein
VKKTPLLLTIVVLCLGTFASADNFTLSNSRANFTADFIDWGQLGPPGNFVTTPAVAFSFLGTNAALVGNANGGDFLTMQEGVTWTGNFDYGENLVWTGNPAFGVGSGGPFIIQLANPVGGIGFGIMADFYGAFTAFVDVYDSNLNFQTTFVVNGVSSGLENGSNLFIGIQDRTAVNIGALVIDTISFGYPTDHDFAMDAVSFNYNTGTPEPTSLILLGSGLIGVAGLVRRKMGR